tara:strand:+ start:28833 stop:29213 length:381 start_codon:yes stop_codon:yes gene_type:complete
LRKRGFIIRKFINRKDSNHNEVAKEFKRLGWYISDVSNIPALCDLRIDRIIDNKHVSIVVEIKDGEKPQSQRKLTKDEVSYLSTFPGNIAIVESLYDCAVLDKLAERSSVIIRYKFDIVLDRGVKK